MTKDEFLEETRRRLKGIREEVEHLSQREEVLEGWDRQLNLTQLTIFVGAERALLKDIEEHDND